MAARRHQPFCLRQGQGVRVCDHHAALAGKGRIHRVQDPVKGCCAEHLVHLRDLIQDLLPVPLGQTAGYDQRLRLPAFPVLRHLQDVLDALFHGVMDEAAGIDDDHIGLCLIIRHLIASRCQKTQHGFRVRQVLITSERNKQYLHI